MTATTRDDPVVGGGPVGPPRRPVPDRSGTDETAVLDAGEVRGLLAAGHPATELPPVRGRRRRDRADSVAPRPRRSPEGMPGRPRSAEPPGRRDDADDWLAELRSPGLDLDADEGPLPSRPVVDAAPGGDPEPLLPPPSDEETASYRDRRLPVLLGASVVSFGSLMVSQVLFLRMSPWLYLFVPALTFTVVYYLISLAVNIGTPGFDLARHRRLVAGWRPTRYPSVDVFLPVCGEALDVLDNTWRHVHRMATHYPGRVCVYVLDDSVSSERENMALSYGYVYQRRPNRGWYKKAGNMRYAYQRTLGDHILVLDADFTPRADMLDQLLPYFDDEPDLGIIQSPQYFRVERRQGWLERGAAAVQELFYRSVQVSRQHHEAAICVGSCAVYRRTALDAIGGSTLIEHSEDVHTGFDMRRRGWRLRYVPVPLAVGLCPADLNSFFTQQYRWCAGSMSLLGSTKFWNLEMRLRQRLSYFSGFCYYAHTALFTFVGPLVPIVMLWFFPHFVRLEHYLLIVPSVIYNFLVFPLWHRTTYRFETWTVKLVYGWAHTFAIWDLLRGQTMGWQPTGSTAKKSRTRRLRAGIGLWSLGTALAWTLLAALRMRTVDVATFTPAFLTGTMFLATVLQALVVDPVRDVPREEK